MEGNGVGDSSARMGVVIMIRHGVLNGDVRGESTTATTRAGMHLPAYV